MQLLKSWGPATAATLILVTIITVAGAVETIAHPETLSFPTYLTLIVGAAGSLGVLALGRGVHLAGKEKAAAINPGLNADPDDQLGGDDLPKPPA